MDELQKALGQLYAEFGHNKVTVKLSQILDDLVAQEQRRRLEQCINMKSCNQSQKQMI